MADAKQSERKSVSKSDDENCDSNNTSQSQLGIHIANTQLFQILLILMVGIYIAYKFPKSVEETKPFIDEILDTIKNLTNEHIDKFNKSYSSLSPSQELLTKSNLNIHEKHPIIMIPGLTSTPLVLWTSKKPQSNTTETDYFYKTCGAYLKRTLRQRIWGGTESAFEMARDTNCWLLSMIINETTGLFTMRLIHSASISFNSFPHPTGLDASFAKVRATEGGTGAVDWLFGMVWIWAYIINNLAQIGYDSNLLYVAGYDWRLSLSNMEVRDLYFTRLKREIEYRVRLNNEKAILMGHSLGGNVATYFLQWINIYDKQWIDKYLDSTVLLAAPLLGVPKYVSMSLSGECLETLILPKPIAYMKEWIIPRPYFNRFARSVHSCMYLQPLGGEEIWGKDDMIKWTVNEEMIDNIDDDQFEDVFDKLMNEDVTEKQDRILKRILQRNYTASNWMEGTIKKIDYENYKHLKGYIENGSPSKDDNISDDSKFGNERYFGNVCIFYVDILTDI